MLRPGIPFSFHTEHGDGYSLQPPSPLPSQLLTCVSLGSICSYPHYIFSLIDSQGSGVITFEVRILVVIYRSQPTNTQDFVITLAMLTKGTQEDKMRWVFSLYDLNGDGWISREEMEDVTHSV